MPWALLNGKLWGCAQEVAWQTFRGRKRDGKRGSRNISKLGRWREREKFIGSYAYKTMSSQEIGARFKSPNGLTAATIEKKRTGTPDRKQVMV